ncbi:MAG: hypothetical protein AAF662_01845 [Pseudomonadota bacterium]
MDSPSVGDRTVVTTWAQRFLAAYRSSPTAFATLGRFREDRAYERRVVRRGDDIVIEGYPRSGNTFSTTAFRQAQNRPVNIGNHFHAPAQILLARRYRIPALVCIRKPEDAALSFMVFSNGRLSALDALERYLKFYSALLPAQEAWVPADFNEIVSSFDKSIARLNRWFGTDFELYRNSSSEDERVLLDIEEKFAQRQEYLQLTDPGFSQIATPSRKKDAQKTLYRAQFAAAPVAGLIEECDACYERVLDHPSATDAHPMPRPNSDLSS